MKNVTDSFLSLGYWSSDGSFGFNIVIPGKDTLLKLLRYVHKYKA